MKCLRVGKQFGMKCKFSRHATLVVDAPFSVQRLALSRLDASKQIARHS
jgi:hypothetical protein